MLLAAPEDLHATIEVVDGRRVGSGERDVPQRRPVGGVVGAVLAAGLLLFGQADDLDLQRVVGRADVAVAVLLD